MLNEKAPFIKTLLMISLVVLSYYGSSQELKIDQKEPMIQNKKEEQIAFQQFEIFKPDINKVVISQVTKIDFHKGRFYILDQRQSRIFVFDKQANYLYSIGTPGQGPGDLEHPSDFAISDKDLVYVVNPMAKRIEVFFIKGDFNRRIELSLPNDIFYAHPSKILVDKKENIYVAYSLSSHLIDVYDEKGKYQKTLVERKQKVTVPGTYLGNSSELLFFQDENYILHFDHFTGIFTKIAKTGKTEKIFSAFAPLVHNETIKIKEESSRSKKEAKSGLQIQDFQLWSNCCFDNNSNIYVFLLLKKKEEQQKMLIFSSEGDFLYWENIPYFVNTKVLSMYCFDDLFMFRTMDEEIFSAKKEAKK